MTPVYSLRMALAKSFGKVDGIETKAKQISDDAYSLLCCLDGLQLTKKDRDTLNNRLLSLRTLANDLTNLVAF